MLKASKKTLSLLLALCLALGCGFVTFAADASVLATVDTTGLSANKVLALTTTDALSGFRTPWKCLAGAKNQVYSIDLWLPDVAEGSEIRLFSLNLLDSGTAAHNDSIIIKDGYVYVAHGSTLKEVSESNRTVTKLCEKGFCDEGLVDAEGNPLGVCGLSCDTPLPQLNPQTWYTFGYTYDILTGEYTATVTEKESGTVFTTISDIRPEKLDAVTAAGTTRLANIIKAKNFSGKLLIDNIVIKGVNDAGTPTAYSAYNADMETATIGDNSFVTKLNSSVVCPVVSEADYLLFGKVDTLMPIPLKLIFTGVDPTMLTDENIKLLANDIPVAAESYSLVPSETEVIISFDVPLKYETTYQVDLTALGISKDISFATPADPFVTTGSEFLSADGNPVYGMPAAGNSIKAAVSFDNGDIEARSYLVLLVIYDGDKMVDAIAAQGEIMPGGDTITTEAVTVPEGDNVTARVMVWNDWQGSYAMSAANVLE